MSRRSQMRRDESGMVIVLVALLMLAMLVVVAIVLDGGQLRHDRRANKSTADFAASAGAQGLKAGPWNAVCDAYRYVLANTREFSSFDTETWSSLAQPPAVPTTYSAGSPAGSCPSGAPYGAPCTGDTSTWASFHGTAGETVVDIQSGYQMPDSSFSEDSALTGDDGSPCEQVAVIIKQARQPRFAQVAGFGPTTTRVRSVSRLTIGPSDVAALVVLERTKCGVIVTTNLSKLTVNATGNRPGIIQVDSDGSGGNPSCNAAHVVEAAKVASTGGATVIANATTGSPSIPGRIGIAALGGANAGNANTEACPLPGASPVTCTIAPVPSFREAIGRQLLDDRYLDGITALRSQASSVFSAPSGYTSFKSLAGLSTCNNVTPGSVSPSLVNAAGEIEVTAQKVIIDCDLNLTSGTLRFSAADSEIASSGTINASSSAALVLDDPRTFFVKGTTSTNVNATAINIAGSLLINANTLTSCAARHDNTNPKGDSSAATKFVVGNGAFDAGAQGVVRMCQTAVYMMSGSLPPVDTYTTNGFNGWVRILGQGDVEWTAPNSVFPGPAAQVNWDDQEDLALWTETQESSQIGGGGVVHLQGVFALPNSDPFVIGGTGSQTIGADAQFWTRKLSLSGQALLTMAPSPNDSIPIFDIQLVR